MLKVKNMKILISIQDLLYLFMKLELSKVKDGFVRLPHPRSQANTIAFKKQETLGNEKDFYVIYEPSQLIIVDRYPSSYLNKTK